MTGFGRGSAVAGSLEIAVEIRTVNGRFLEVSVRAPRELSAHEVEIQNSCRAALSRGKVNVVVQVEDAADASPLSLDEPLARAYGQVLERLRFITGVAQPVQLDHLLQFRDIIASSGGGAASVGADTLWAATSEALEAALEGCRAMRFQEGLALADDLRARLSAIDQLLREVELGAGERIIKARDTLRARLAELLGDDSRVDRDRLEMEVAVLADKLDVNEECVRLRSHIEQFEDALESDEPVGRRLNFLAQEMNREINTLAAKSSQADMAHRAVRMKEELEKIREQVQNVA